MPELVIGFPKVVVTLATTRSETFLRNQLTNNIWPNLRQVVLDAITADPQSTHVSHTVDLWVKTFPAEGLAQIYPKFALTIDTTRSAAAIKNTLDGILDEWKTIFRAAVASDPKTTIDHWHLHRLVGSPDETEP